MSTTHDDPLADLFNAAGEATTARRETRIPETYTAPTFEEPCPKCRGTGRFVGYTGRVLGECFTCKGKGKKVFKSSTETRARTRQQAQARRERTADENWNFFAQTNPAEAKWLLDTAPRRDLAGKFFQAVRKYGKLTEKQMAVVTNGIARDAARTAQRQDRVTNAPTVDVSKISETFARARRNTAQDRDNVKWLTLRLDTFKFSDAPASVQYPDPAIFVKEGEVKLGRIVNGKFLRTRECDDATAARVVAAAQDPVAGATAYGLKWKSCSICGRTLTAEESRERAIGPICYGRFFGEGV